MFICIDIHDIRKQLETLAGPPEGLSEGQQRTHDRLLDAAAAQFAEYGYRRTNIADVAEAAGVAKGTVYLYFSSKIQLLMASVAREQLALLPEMERAMELPPHERLEAYVKTLIRFTVTSPLSAGLIRGDQELSAAVADAEDEGILLDPAEEISMVAGLVADTAPGLPVRERELLSQVLLVVTTLPAHVSELGGLLGLPADDFVDTYARILARGVAAHRPEH